MARGGVSFGDAHDMLQVNDVARRLVRAAGFEVFDPLAATLHADRRWFDKEDERQAEALADLITQMLINQLCNADRTRLARRRRVACEEAFG